MPKSHNAPSTRSKSAPSSTSFSASSRYRHAPNTGSRKSWAAGDATSRALRLALIAKTGEMGYPSVHTAKTWGFYDVSFRGQEFRFQRPYDSYVMENVLFKISFPAEFHAQTAVEASMALYGKLRATGKSADDIRKITIRTHEAALRIIDKKGPLNNPADRDHCLQYMIAIPLLFGRLVSSDYEDRVAADPRVDVLREKMETAEVRQFTPDYHDPEKRSIANSLRMELTDGTVWEETVEYPIGHKRRRKESLPLLEAKFKANLARRISPEQQADILKVSLNQRALEDTPVHEYADLYAVERNAQVRTVWASGACQRFRGSTLPSAKCNFQQSYESGQNQNRAEGHGEHRANQQRDGECSEG